MTPSFSRQVKEELVALEGVAESPRRYMLLFSLMNIGVYRGRRLTVSSMQESYLDLLRQELSYFLGVESRLEAKGRLFTLQTQNLEAYQEVTGFLEQEGNFVAVRGLSQMNPEALSEEERRGALRGLFLSSGSLQEPGRAYHLEMSFRRSSIMDLALQLFQMEQLPARVLQRPSSARVYLKEAQPIVDFLALTGAHRAVLAFENLRIEKDLRNDVNRMVNCDSANLKRVASTAVRQIRHLEAVLASGGWEAIPEDLQALARLRLEQPELSLRELGESLDPPLTRSAVQRRMLRLEALPTELQDTEL